MNNEAEMEPKPGTRELGPEEVGPDTDRLRDYAKSKHAVAQAVRSIRSLASEAKNDKVAAESQELMTKLAEDRFTLAVVGQFKRGKSSLMNAIIGRELLPTGVLPLTSAITVLKYGPVEKLSIQRDGDMIPEEPPVTRLAAYVTEEGNPGNRQKVKAAVLEEPIPFLRRGLEFVDTPGVGSAIVANTETAYSFLPQCDAVIFVTGVDGPLTEAEVDFLRCTQQFAQKMFFVINKTDLFEGDEREKALKFISERLRAEMRNESLRTFPLSSRLAMAAKSSADSAAYTSSGLRDFEEALGAFLSQERAGAFLASVLAKSVRLVENLNSGTLADASSTKCNRIRGRLQAIQELLFPGTAPERPIPAQSAGPGLIERERQPDEPAINWLKALRTRGCPLCVRLADAAFNFYARWQHALVADEAAQDQFAAEMGFCPLHTWQFLSVSSPQGTSAGYAKLAERCARRLSALAAGSDAAGHLAPRAPGREQCAVCRKLCTVEENAIRGLASFLMTAGGLRAYRDSQGVCMRHLGLLTAGVRNADLVRQILQHGSRRFEETAEDMQNYAMKHDGTRRWLQNQDEKDAYLRAVIHLVGEKAVCTPWQEDVEI